ncbi:ACT domain-containing protein [Bradyrhizobium sp. USDA 4353]
MAGELPGERNLDALLLKMTPELQEGVFVFCSLAAGDDPPATLTPLMLFREREGVTLIVRREEAEQAGLSYQFAARLITLSVHSALDAVGFLAAVTTALAVAGISVNAVSAFHHDHLFVPEAQAEQALSVLREMSRGAG